MFRNNTRNLVAASLGLAFATTASAQLTTNYQNLINTTADLQNYWGFEDVAIGVDFTTVADTKAGKDGTAIGTVTSAAGVVGNAGYFPGDSDDAVSNNYIELIDSNLDSTFELQGSFTVEALVRADDLLSAAEEDWLAIFSKGDSAWRIARQRGSSGVQMAASDVGSITINESTISLDNDIWHYVAMTYDIDTGLQTAWFDNVAISQSITPGTNVNIDVDDVVMIGHNSDTTNREWTGYIDEVALYTRALTETEVMARVNLLETDPSAIEIITSVPAENVFWTGDADALFTTAGNWEGTDNGNTFAPADWVAPRTEGFISGTGIAISGDTTVTADISAISNGDNPTGTVTVESFEFAGEEGTTTNITWDGGNLIGAGSSHALIGNNGNLNLTINGGLIAHNGGGEEETEIVIAEGNTGVTNIVLNNDAMIATGNVLPVVANDPNDPDSDLRLAEWRRPRLGDKGYDENNDPINPERWGDDIKVGEGGDAHVVMNDNSEIVVFDVFYMNDEPNSDADSSIIMNDQSKFNVLWDTRFHDEPGTHRSELTMNDDTFFFAAFDHALGEAGTGFVPQLLEDGTANPDAAESGRERYEIDVELNGNAQMLAGDRFWIGAGSDRFFQGEDTGNLPESAYRMEGNGVRVYGLVEVTLNGNAVLKAGNDDGTVNFVDGTGTNAEIRTGDQFIQIGHGAEAIVTINDNALMEANRHIYVGSGTRGNATVIQNGGNVNVIGNAAGSDDTPFGLAGNTADTSYRPDRGWLDRGGQLVVSYDTPGTYYALGGNATPDTELYVGYQPGSNGFMKIEGGNVAAGRDVIIGALDATDDEDNNAFGHIEFVSGNLSGRDLRVGYQGVGQFTLTGSDLAEADAPGTIQFTGDISFNGDFNSADGDGSSLVVNLFGPDMPTIEGIGGAFSSGSSETNLLLWNSPELLLSLDGYRPEKDMEFDLITFGGSRNGEFTYDFTSLRTSHGIEAEIAYNNEDGETLFESAVTLVITDAAIAGDANFDGNVDLLDLSALASNFEDAGAWAQGDFNLDGVVDLLDLSILASNFGTTAVPAPASAALISLGALALRRRSA